MSSTPPDNSASQPVTDSEQMVIRRAPKVAPFLVGGGVVGAIIGLILVSIFGVPENYSAASISGFFILIFGIPGVAVGALVWLIVDRRSKKRQQTVYTREVTDPAAADYAIKTDDWQEYTERSEAQANEPTRAELKEQYKADKQAKKEARKARRAGRGAVHWPEESASETTPEDGNRS